MSEPSEAAPRCWFLHKWGQWSDIILTKDGWPMQHRKCLRCNRVQVETA